MGLNDLEKQVYIEHYILDLQLRKFENSIDLKQYLKNYLGGTIITKLCQYFFDKHDQNQMKKLG